MLRKFLTIVVPLLLPTLIFIAYAAVERRRALAKGAGAPAPWWVNAPWPWLLGSGVLLMGITLAAWALVGESGDPGGVYEPARVIDGRVVGGQVTPPSPPPDAPPDGR